MDILIIIELISICILIRHIQIQTEELKKQGNKKAEIYLANHNSLVTFLLFQILVIVLIAFGTQILKIPNQIIH